MFLSDYSKILLELPLLVYIVGEGWGYVFESFNTLQVYTREETLLQSHEIEVNHNVNISIRDNYGWYNEEEMVICVLYTQKFMRLLETWFWVKYHTWL